MPEVFFHKIKLLIKKEWKIAFFSAIIIGFLTHMYVFTNMLPNHDGLINIYNSQQKYSLGRFFLAPFSGISSFFDLPWINGSLSIFYLAITSALVTELYELKKAPAIILSSGVITSFPTVAATFSYMFTADGYMLGFLLVALAVIITQKYKYGFLPASIMLFVSVGIYQANLSIVLVLVGIWFIKELLLGNQALFILIISIVKQAVMTTIGMAVYLFIFNAYQTFFKGGITSYQGLDKIGHKEQTIVEQLRDINEVTNEFFFRGFITDYPINLFEIINVLFLALVIVGIVLAVMVNKVYQSSLRVIAIVVTTLLLPIFIFVLYFVSPGVVYHMLMVMAIAFIYLLPLIIYDGLNKPVTSVKLFAWGTMIVLFLNVFNFALINNISYLNMSLKYEKSYSLANRVLTRAEQMDGFENVSKMAVIGRPNVKTNLGSNIVPENIPKMTGATGEVFLAQPYHFSAMFSNYLGIKLEVLESEELDKLRKSNLVKDMKSWPAKQSILIKHDMVIINFE